MLTGSGGTINSRFSYDAYGILVGGQPSVVSPAATSLLYSGEQFDSDLQQYYLRARFYDPANGRFNRLDPFAGSNYDPQSLHKYAYGHQDPVNAIDPSGRESLISLIVGTSVKTIIAAALIGGILSEVGYFLKNPVDKYTIGGALRAFGKGALKGAFGATLIGSAYFALEAIIDGIEVWQNPSSTGLQKALATVNVLIGAATAVALKGQIKSQFFKWKNEYSKIPITLEVQTDLNSIKQQFSGSKQPLKFGNRTIQFGGPRPGQAGGFMKGQDGDFITLYDDAFKDDETLMKTIIEENLHIHRANKGLIEGGLDATEAFAGMGPIVGKEEAVVGAAVEDIYTVGKNNSWW